MEEFYSGLLSDEDKALLKAGAVALADYAVEKSGRILLVSYYRDAAISNAAIMRGTVIHYDHKTQKWMISSRYDQ